MKYLNRIVVYTITVVAVLTLTVSAQTAKHMGKIAIDGYCPVAYHVLKKAKKGSPKYSFTYEGKTYHFVNAKAKMMFEKDPAKFLPEYDGYCATAMYMGKKLKSNPKLFTLYEGHTYLFSTIKAKQMFDKNPGMYVKKANEEFAMLNNRNIALDGYCPVAYHVLKKAVKGNPKYSSTYKGKTYHFVNAKAKKMFDKDPAKFLPEYGGYCTTAMSMGKKLKSNPKLFVLYKGHTYLFSSKKAKAMFEKDPVQHIAEANKVYASENK